MIYTDYRLVVRDSNGTPVMSLPCDSNGRVEEGYLSLWEAGIKCSLPGPWSQEVSPVSGRRLAR